MQQIDADHMLVDLATMNEVKGATSIDESGLAKGERKDLNNEMKTFTLQLHLGAWKIVKRGR